MTARDAIRAREARRSPEAERPPETDVERMQWDPYASWTKPQLVELAESLGLDTSGTKAEILARLTQWPG